MSTLGRAPYLKFFIYLNSLPGIFEIHNKPCVLVGRLKPFIADSAKPNADLDKSC